MDNKAYQILSPSATGKIISLSKSRNNLHLNSEVMFYAMGSDMLSVIDVCGKTLSETDQKNLGHTMSAFHLKEIFLKEKTIECNQLKPSE